MNAYLAKHQFTSGVFQQPKCIPQIVVCIPATHEPDLLSTLRSLRQANATYAPNVLIIILLNHSERAESYIKAFNNKTLQELQRAQQQLETVGFEIQIQLLELPKKHAGVGLARKILMDEAVRILDGLNPQGIIAATDGDSLVAPNYFQAIDDFFSQNPKLEAASIHYEHILPKDPSHRMAIIDYELHLRYFVEAQRMTGLPTAFQTIGSSMAVRQLAYQLQGGMNRRKAGEDFYFLQKFARKGTLGNLPQTTVYPSPRVSDRVPFGTGRAIGQFMKDHEALTTHQLIIFDQVKLLFAGLSTLWNASSQEILRFQTQLPPAVQDFLAENNFLDRVLEIQKHTASQTAFRKRFFNWFDGFVMMKYVHHARDLYYPDQPVGKITLEFAKREMGFVGEDSDMEELLGFYRLKHLNLNIFRP